MSHRLLLLIVALFCCTYLVAQETPTRETPPATFVVGDSLLQTATDSTVQSVLAKADSIGVPEVKLDVKQAFKPNPTKAVLLGLVPGLGQIYNRKYWKLPIG